MYTLKMDSKPFVPTHNKESRENKLIEAKIVYSSNFLMFFKDYNHDLPEDCDHSKIDFVNQSQKYTNLNQFEIKTLNTNDFKKEKKNDQKDSSFFKKQQTKSHAQFTQKRYQKSPFKKYSSQKDEIEILKPINSLSITEMELNPNEVILLDNNEISSYDDSSIEKRITSREKQILFGKSTKEYQNYIKIIPKEKRLISDPKTPDIQTDISKRKWDKVIRRWRRSLHAFDDVQEENQVNLARALAFRLQNENNPKKLMTQYQGRPYDLFLIDE